MTKDERLKELKEQIVPLLDGMSEEKQYLALGVIIGADIREKKNALCGTGRDTQHRKTG